MDKSFNDRLLKRLGERTKAIDEKLAAAMHQKKSSSSPSREVKKTEIYTTSVKTTTRIDYFDDKSEAEVSSGEDMPLISQREKSINSRDVTRRNDINRPKKLNIPARGDSDSGSGITDPRLKEDYHTASDSGSGITDPRLAKEDSYAESDSGSGITDPRLAKEDSYAESDSGSGITDPRLAKEDSYAESDSGSGITDPRLAKEDSYAESDSSSGITDPRLAKDSAERESSNGISNPRLTRKDNYNGGSDSGMSKSSSSSSKLAVKLAALVSSINQREDDLRHVVNKPKPEKPEVANRPWRGGFMPSRQQTIVPQQFPGSLAKARPEPKTKSAVSLAGPNRSTPKPVVLDRSVLANLEAQGFERCESHSNLAYDYRKEEVSQKANEELVSKQTPEKIGQVKEVIEKCNDRDSKVSSPVNLSPSKESPSTKDVMLSPILGRGPIPRVAKARKSPLKFNIKPFLGVAALNMSPSKPNPAVAATVVTGRCAKPANPERVNLEDDSVGTFVKNSPARTSVRHLSNLYESSSNLMSPKKPDPAELPLAQRKALFEKHKGAPVMPRPIGFEKNRAQPNPSSTKTGEIVITLTRRPSTNSNLKAKPFLPQNQSTNKEKGLSSVVAKFEQGTGSDRKPEHIQKAQTERQREIDELRHRWDSRTKSEEFVVPIPPPLPSKSPSSASKTKAVTFSPKDVIEEFDSDLDTSFDLTNISASSVKSPKDYPGLKDTKPITVSPPKPGHLYPNLSTLDIPPIASSFEDLMEYCDIKRKLEESKVHDSSLDESDDADRSGDSLGGVIKKAVLPPPLSSSDFIKMLGEYRARKTIGETESSSDSESVTKENNNLLDEFLDEALDDDDSETPPKRRRSGFEQDNSSSASHSFEYQHSSSRADQSRTKQQPANQPSGSSDQPLQHTISFYRRNQTLTHKTPISPRRQFINSGYEEDSIPSSDDDVSNEREAVDKKIKELQQEIFRQEAIISQASQALNLCMATVEFSSSTEQTEAEKLLLVATHKRQALVHEVQRLKVEKTIRPLGPDNAKLTEQGDLIISNITLPLKLDNIRAAARDEKCVQLICLAKCGAQVVATSMETTNPRNLHDMNKLTFPKSLTLEGLYSDFKVAIEVYGLATKSKELLPHEIKYHIAKSKKDANKHGLTPKKSKHQDDNKLVRPAFQSMGGPNVVRSTQFSLIGYVVFSLREINRMQFNLNKVPYTSVLEGMILMKMSCHMTMHIVHRGFLTMFDDISGMGAWHRRWSQLNGDKISYWKYPEDEKKKIPIDTIDLNACITEVVNTVPRDVCARSHTFLLETVRSRKADDEKSLILIPDGKRTIIRHLLSADSKEERMEWCKNLNHALALLRAWGKKKH